MSGDKAVTQRVRELQSGARLLRDNPDAIQHAALVALVADWIDAEALMWETSQQFVELINGMTAKVSGTRAGEVTFGVVDGKPKTVIDTSTHADRIIAAANGAPQ